MEEHASPSLEGKGRLASRQRVGAKRRPMINPAAHFIRVDPPPPGEGKERETYKTPTLRIALRASDSPISTKAEVTSGPPTRMRVGIFILFHS